MTSNSERATEWAAAYGAGAVTFGAADAAWIGLAARRLYESEMPHLMSSTLSAAPALGFYALYLAGTVHLATRPGEERGMGRRIRDGAILGACAYGAWGLTGAAVLDRFPVSVALIDMAWGAFGTALTAAVAGIAADRVRGRQRSRSLAPSRSPSR
ncbi:MAG TPA: DUF2177 family protein [Actinomycetales bacterium]|nr:DUF2177 family protein [Actinomycetales bacterium]